MEGPNSLPTQPIKRIGFACVLSDGSLTTNHTFLLRDFSMEKMTEVAHRNLDDLERILFLMSDGPLRLLRLGSSLIPFASHEARTFDWIPLVEGRLRWIGNFYSERGFRLSMHPGQYTILNSPDPRIVERSIAEISYSCDVLDAMGLNGEHKIVVHGGGVYGERTESTKRLIQQLVKLPDRVRRRLVIEHDERLFNLGQILEVCEAAGLPAVFDLHHQQIGPSDDLSSLLLRVAATWDCRPKVHLSSQKPGARPGTHDDLLDRRDFEQLCELLPFEADLMVEAKAKEQAAMQAWTWKMERELSPGAPPL